MIKGIIHSIQTLGTLDGPGVRFVVFTKGCNLRCHCCHNPDTWTYDGGKEYTPEEIVTKAKRYREYFGNEGGITVSGGEPLLQSEFVYELFHLCRQEGINTCLDTSGSILNDSVKKLLGECDRVLLDIKYTDNERYMKHVGCTLDTVLEFLRELNCRNIPTTVRQVVIPTVNDRLEDFLSLKALVSSLGCVDKTELLAFKKICETKYDALGIEFPFKDVPTESYENIKKYQELLK